MSKTDINRRIVVIENCFSSEQISFENKPEYIASFLKTHTGTFDLYDEFGNCLFRIDSQFHATNIEEMELLESVNKVAKNETVEVPYINCFNVDPETNDSLIHFKQKLYNFMSYPICTFIDMRTRRTENFTKAFNEKCDSIREDVCAVFQMTYPFEENKPVNPVQQFSFNGIRFNVTIHSMDNQTVLDFDIE